MHPTLITYYGHRLRTRVKIEIEKAKIFLIQTKMYIISGIEIAYFYMQEFRVQAKVFKNNRKELNRFRKPTNYDY